MLKFSWLSIFTAGLLLVGCGGGSGGSSGGSSGGDSSSEVVLESDYSAEITRTEYGIPHIKADSWGSLGYGYGYAYAQDNFCVVMREVVLASGRSAELMGEEDAWLQRKKDAALENEEIEIETAEERVNTN